MWIEMVALPSTGPGAVGRTEHIAVKSWVFVNVTLMRLVRGVLSGHVL